MEILFIPELVAEGEPKTTFYIITDLRTKRLAGIRWEIKIFKHPMLVLLPAKFLLLGCPAALGGGGHEAGQE